jgi:hypothetical protein
MEIKFQATESLRMENSFGTIREQDQIILSITIGINEDGDYGWFELFDDATGGDDWYAEGGLWFDGKELTDYDGVFGLPLCIIEKLEELGFDAEYAK